MSVFLTRTKGLLNLGSSSSVIRALRKTSCSNVYITKYGLLAEYIDINITLESHFKNKISHL